MSKMSKVAGRIGAVAIAVAAAATMTTGSASAAPLPNGQKVVTAPEGWSIVLKSSGNSYAIQPTMATPQSRSVWIRTTGTVDVKAPASVKDIQGKLGVAVIYGCQFPGQIAGGVNVAGPSASLGTSPSLGLGGVSPYVTIPLSPGATQALTGYNQSDQPGGIDNIKFTKPGTYNVVIRDQNVDIPFCSGYAQARVATFVEIKGSNRIQGFLYGAPFSMG